MIKIKLVHLTWLPLIYVAYQQIIGISAIINTYGKPDILPIIGIVTLAACIKKSAIALIISILMLMALRNKVIYID